MKRFNLIIVLLTICLAASGQSFMRFESKRFNYGAKVGFNATFPIINSLSINDKEASNIEVEHKVGYLAAIYCRFNINRFFLQPSLAWHKSEGNIRFSMPKDIQGGQQQPSISKPRNMMNMRTKSFEMPIILGYNLVKEGPYGLSLMAGPKIKYNYNVAYTVESPSTQVEFINDNTPFGVNIATGVGVSIVTITRKA